MASDLELKVISLGVARTASLSMYTALCELGYQNVFHSTALSARTPAENEIWWELMQKKFVKKQSVTRADLDRVTWDREARTSAPYWLFWRELMDAYPDAKFILVERDKEAWYPSFITIIKAVMFSWYTPIVKWYAEPLVGRSNMALSVPIVMHYYFGAWSLDELKANARPVYKAHRKNIIEKAAKDGRSLLLYELGSGWQPLCDFLDRPVPDTPFPRVNGSKDITARIALSHRRHIWRATVQLSRYIGGVAIASIAWYAMSYWTWRQC